MKRATLALMLLVLLIPANLASANDHVETVVTFDAASGEFPEGIAADHRGNLYVSLAPLGQIWQLAPDGSSRLFASLVDPASLPLPLGALGIAVDPTGDVYVALASFDPTSHGVWRITRDGAHLERLPGTESILLPNGLAFDQRRNLYVTDSLLGAVWRVAPSEAARVWVQHELLVGINIPELALPIGANGVAFWREGAVPARWPRAMGLTQGELYVANTTTKQVVRILIGRDGGAATPEVAMTFTGPADFLDGVAVDVHGRLYLPMVARSALVRVTQAGEITTLAAASDGLDFPASAAFGNAHGTRHTLFITNFAVFPSADPHRPGPGVVKIEIDLQP